MITNNQVWKDTQGNDIKCQGGSMIKVMDTYYWYGMELRGGSKGPGDDAGIGDWSFERLKCYSSKDLMTWKFEKDIFVPETSGTPDWLTKTIWVGRPQIYYNPRTNKYVLICEWSNPKQYRNSLAYFTCSSPTGIFIAEKTEMGLFENTLGDLGGFQDTDGKGYLLLVSDEGGLNLTANIVELYEDYIGVKSICQKFSVGNSEAFSMLKRGSKYYLFNSGTDWWFSTPTKYRTATCIKGPWSEHRLVATLPTSENSFNTQHDFIVTIEGTESTSYIYAGDRYSNFHGNGIGLNAWYPLTFDKEGIPTLHGSQNWTIDMITGVWKIEEVEN